MIEQHTVTSKTEVFEVKDTISGDTYDFELQTDYSETTKSHELDQFTAQKLIAQEEAAIQTYSYNRRDTYKTCASLGVISGLITTLVGLVADGEKYGVDTFLASGAVVGTVVTAFCIGVAEFANHVNGPAVAAANELIEERIHIIKRNTDWY